VCISTLSTLYIEVRRMIKKLALTESARRAKKYRRIGYKDGLCGMMKALKELPADMRAAYKEGHTNAMVDSEQLTQGGYIRDVG
jgi:hypothetical protein